jgi:lysophospholipase L1-like esterase
MAYNPTRLFGLLTILLLIGCSGPQLLPGTSTFGELDMPSRRYLALGDSYTIGESVAAQDRWPDQLARSLAETGIQTEVTIIARTGWTTDELREGIEQQEITPPYDLVSLLIGVNNQYRGYDIDQYREEFAFLLNKSIEYAGGDPNHVIVLSIPDWGVTPFAWGRDTSKIAQEIDAFNAVNREESEKANVRYVDVTPISRAALEDKELLASDSLHPAGKMYAQWAQLVLPVALEIFR